MKIYLDLLQKIIDAPEYAWKGNRTGTRAKSISGHMLEHDMNEGFPLLTTKFVSLKMVAVELEGFIKAITDKKWYEDRKCYIWSDWCNPKKVPYGNDEESKAKMICFRIIAQALSVCRQSLSPMHLKLIKKESSV